MENPHKESRVISFLKSAYRYRIRQFPLTRFERIFRRVEPIAVIGHRALARLYKSVGLLQSEQVPGDVVECGVARGGSAKLLALALKEHGIQKDLWLYDSFEGMPEPSPEKDPDYDVVRQYVGACRGNLEKVRQQLVETELRADRIRIVVGMFEDTLVGQVPEQIALLHIDCDWYESVWICFKELFDRVADGGIIQIDDYYTWKGCRKATDEFFSSLQSRPQLHRIDRSAVWMRK